MWNEMVKDEEITFNGEESVHPGTACVYTLLSVLWFYSLTEEGKGQSVNLCTCFAFILEDCTDCFGVQKKDEPNDKDKKEEEETATSVHHSIIETWDWGRQPGERPC